MPFFDIFSKRKVKKKEELKIIVDNRERNSLVISELMNLGFEIEYRQLPVADYLVGEIAIERKTIGDLKSSIINKRIISQLLELKQYKQNILIVEGILEEDMYKGILHENAFRGFLISICLDYGVQMIFTQDAKDTAKYLAVLAKRKGKKEPSIRASKIFRTPEERVQFILEGFPNVGPVSAKKLIGKFGSLREIINAGEDELKKILGKKAKEFKELIERNWD